MTQGEKKRHPTVRIEQVDEGDEPERAGTPPSDPGRQRRLDAQLLAALLTTREQELERFRRLRLGPESRVSDDDLRLARDVLETIVGALRDDDPDQWLRIRAAAGEMNEPGPADEPTSIVAPEPAERPDRSIDPVEAPPSGQPSPWLRPWGQAYAAGSLPNRPTPTPAAPRTDGYAPAPSASRPSAAEGRGHGGDSSREGPYRYDREGTQLIRHRELEEGGSHEGYRQFEGYDPPPPPSEPTRPHRSSEPAASPPPPAATEIVPDSTTPARRRFHGEEDSATNQLSFTSQAHPLAMTVEEYAGLCAERAHSPQLARAIARRYEICDSEVMAAVELAFEIRFARDVSLRTRWQRAYARFTASLRER